MEEKKGKMAVEEMDKRGGLKTSETYRELFFKEIKRKGTKAKEIGKWQLKLKVNIIEVETRYASAVEKAKLNP